MFARRTLTMLFSILMCASLLTGCGDEPTAPSTTLESHASAQPEMMSKPTMTYENGVKRYDGVIGGTNIYAIFVPDEWNGDLVVYAHGFLDAALPIHISDNDRVDEIRKLLVADGYAFACSSYRENGFAVQSGGWATKNLCSLFRSLAKSAPEHTWLVGHSLGGLVTLEMAEKNPGNFDGILSLAGVTGGTARQLDYVAHVRILFDFFYSEVLPGDVLNVPADLTPQELQDLVLPAVMADPTGVYLISQIDQSPLPSPTPEAMIASLLYALTWNVRGIDDVLWRTHGETPIDNMDTMYSSSSGAVPQPVLDLINATVPRYDRTDGADAEMRRNYEPTGHLEIPMTAVHNYYDPAVPYFHALAYQQKVEAMGNGDLFDLVTYPDFEHSNFDPLVVISAFQDLVDRAAVTTF